MLHQTYFIIQVWHFKLVHYVTKSLTPFSIKMDLYSGKIMSFLPFSQNGTSYLKVNISTNSHLVNGGEDAKLPCQ